MLELLVVLVVLIALAGIVVPLLTGVSESSRDQATRESLRQLQQLLLDRYRFDMQGVGASTDAIVKRGFPGPDTSHLAPPSRQDRPQLLFLFVNPVTGLSEATFDPVTKRGWRGPYLPRGRFGTYPGLTPATAAARGFDSRFGEPGDETVLDAWGNPIVILSGATSPELVSAGPDGSLNVLPNITVPLQ